MKKRIGLFLASMVMSLTFTGVAFAGSHDTESQRPTPIVVGDPAVGSEGLPKCYPPGIVAGDIFGPGVNDYYPAGLEDCDTKPAITPPATDADTDEAIEFAANAAGLYLIVAMILAGAGLTVVVIIIAAHFRKL